MPPARVTVTAQRSDLAQLRRKQDRPGDEPGRFDLIRIVTLWALSRRLAGPPGALGWCVAGGRAEYYCAGAPVTAWILC